jgi:mRNA interferase RelE/StbE
VLKPYRTEIPPRLAEVVRSLHPDLKRFVKAGLQSIAPNPESGEPLHGELRQYWKYRVRRFRIVYAIDRTNRRLLIVAVAHRREVYEELAARLKKQTS